MKRKSLLSILTISALGFAAFGVASLHAPIAHAQNQAETPIAWMEDGASVRFSGTGSGLRFTMQIRADKFDEDATYGILIAPEDGYVLSEENVFGEKAIYNWAVKDEHGEWKYTPEDGKTQIVNLVTQGFNDDVAIVNGESVAVKEFYGSLVDLDESNFAREFRGVGYIRTGTAPENYDYTLVGDSDNVRSMAYVAQLAIEDTSDKAPTGDQKTQLQQKYLDKVADVASSYTQEYYLQQADGSYQKLEALTETFSEYNGTATTIGDAVSFVAKEIAGATFDAENENNVLSGTVYANNNLVLKGYYTRTPIETLQGEARMIEVEDGEYNLANLLTGSQAETFAQYSALGEIVWKFNGVALESAMVDFSTTAKRAYTVTANLGEEVAYTAEIDFYNENETVWSLGVNVDDLVIKLDRTVAKDIVTDPAGKTGDFYQITTENVQYHAFVKPVHTKAYYERLQGKGIALNFSVYTTASTSTDTLMAFATNTIMHVMGSKWYDISISLDVLLADWEQVFNAGYTADYHDAMLMTRDATSTTFYVSEVTCSIDGGNVVEETAVRLIDVNGSDTYNMGAILTGAGVSTEYDVVYTLSPVTAGEDVVITEDFIDFNTAAKRAYNVTASISVYGLQAPIYKGIVDFYDSNEAPVWVTSVSADDVVIKNTPAEVEKSTVENPAGKTGAYYQITTTSNKQFHAFISPAHTQEYYQLFQGAKINLTFELYHSGKSTIEMAFNTGSTMKPSGSTWYTYTISLDTLLTKWTRVFDPTKTDAWSDSMFFVRTATKATHYIGNYQFAIASGTVVTDTTERLIDLNGVEAYDMNNVLSAAGVEESVYANKNVVWELTPINGGDKATVTNEATEATVEKRAYNATASISVYGLLSPIYTGVVDFYDSTESLVWNDELSIANFDFEDSNNGKAKEVTADIVNNAPNRTGEYLALTTFTTMVTLLPKHTLTYYTTVASDMAKLYFDFYLETDTPEDKTYKTVLFAGGNKTTWAGYNVNFKLNTWNTEYVSIKDYIVAYWSSVVLTTGEAGATYDGYNAARTGFIGFRNCNTAYIGNFRVVEE